MRQKAMRVVGMYPKLGAVIVWGSVVLMTAAWLAGMAGCQSIPTRVIVHVEVHR